MTTKGEKVSILQIGSKRHYPLVNRNMKRMAHKRKDKNLSHSKQIKGTRRNIRR
jgi:hypothetical protein